MKEEIWKEIEGYNGDYLISNHGRVKSFKGKSKEGKILSPSSVEQNYVHVNLSKNNKKKCELIHRLVAKSFIKNPNHETLIIINHIDKNKHNNYFENLEWCTYQYNVEYSRSKYYKIQFPNGCEEIIFNLSKFCIKYNLHIGTLYNTIKNGYSCHKFKLLEIIDDGRNTIKKIKKTFKRFYTIKLPNENIELIFNLTNFCNDNELNINCMLRTLKKDCFHKGYKILEKIDKDGIITKSKK